MFKLVIILTCLILALIFSASFLFEKFAVWDAANPDDDKSEFHGYLIGLTPQKPAGNLNQSLDLNTGLIIIDVRTPEEFSQGHIKNAVNIPEETLYAEAPKRFTDKKELIFLYCDSGHRGAVATRLLRSMGYDRAFNLEYGLKGWLRTGFHLVKPLPAYF